MLSYPEFIVQVSDLVVIKLLTIVGYDRMGKAKPTYDVLSEEFCGISFGNSSKRFCLDPFREVVDRNNGEGRTFPSIWQWAYKINPHLANGQGLVTAERF